MYILKRFIARKLIADRRIRRYLTKALARDIVYDSPVIPNVCDDTDRNLCGLGGQGAPVYTVSWEELWDTVKTAQAKEIFGEAKTKAAGRGERSLLEGLFFAYFGPLEAYCERIFQEKFYLWSDDKNVSLIIPGEADRMFWQLRFGDKMRLPSWDELDAMMESVR